MNYLLDNNIIIDLLSETRANEYKDSIRVFQLLEKRKLNTFISSSSIDNIEFILFKEIKNKFNHTNRDILKITHIAIADFLTKVKIAKTPSYIELDYEDIEDSQIIATAKAIDAKVITRDDRMLQKYQDIAITPTEFLKTKNQKLKTKIDFANLKKQYFMYLPELEKEMDKVLNNASYIMGDAVKKLEENLCKFTGAKNAVTCSSGTDALLLAMMAIDIKPGDEIITTPFTFIATAETIALLGAKPVFVDIDETTYNIDPNKIEEKITPKTKAIIAVSLYGQPCDLDKLKTVTDNYQLSLIIDGAQSFGATYKGKAEVHYADIYTTSFFPAKPLGCFGDGGAVLTNNDELAQKMRMLRFHGQNKRYHHKYIGLGARMDTIQCAITDVKLKHYEKDLAKRQEVAGKYTKLLSNNQYTNTPITKPDRTSAWAQYSIRVQNRDNLQASLKEQGIPTAIHYPMPLHLQECFKYLGYKEGDFPVAERVSKEIMSLPMNPYLSDEEIEYIAKEIVNAINN